MHASGQGSDVVLDQLLQAARAGSTDAIGQVLERYRKYLLLVANDELEADLQGKLGPSDLVQDSFLEAHRDFGRFRGGSEAELQAWLRRILLNNVANAIRQFRRTGKRRISMEVSLDTSGSGSRERPQPVVETPSPRSKAIAREQEEALDRALVRLPEHYREVLLEHHRDKRTFEEIAGDLARSTGAVRKLWTRAIQMLQEEMGRPDA